MCFSLYGETNKNCILMSALFSNAFLCIIFTSADSDYLKSVRYHLKVLHLLLDYDYCCEQCFVQK